MYFLRDVAFIMIPLFPNNAQSNTSIDMDTHLVGILGTCDFQSAEKIDSYSNNKICNGHIVLRKVGRYSVAIECEL